MPDACPYLLTMPSEADLGFFITNLTGNMTAATITDVPVLCIPNGLFSTMQCNEQQLVEALHVSYSGQRH